MFGGIGGAYATLGFARGVEEFPRALRETRDDRRRVQREDEELAAWRDDRREAGIDRGRRRRFEDVDAGRADTRYGWEVDDREREVQMRPELDQFAADQRGEERRRWGVQRAQDEISAQYAPELARLGVQDARLGVQSRSLGIRAAQQGIEQNDWQARERMEARGRDQSVRSVDRVFGMLRGADPSKVNLSIIDRAYEEVQDGVASKSRFNPETKKIETRLVDESTGEELGVFEFNSFEEMHDAALRQIDASMAIDRRNSEMPRGYAPRVIQGVEGYGIVDPAARQVVPLTSSTTGEQWRAPARQFAPQVVNTAQGVLLVDKNTREARRLTVDGEYVDPFTRKAMDRLVDDKNFMWNRDKATGEVTPIINPETGQQMQAREQGMIGLGMLPPSLGVGGPAGVGAGAQQAPQRGENDDLWD